MSILPLHNARLRQVNAVGESAQFDVAPTPGAQKWAGDAEAFFASDTQEMRAGSFQHNQGSLRIPSNLKVVIEPGDTVTFTYRGETLVSGVRMVEDRSTFAEFRLTLYDTVSAGDGG